MKVQGKIQKEYYDAEDESGFDCLVSVCPFCGEENVETDEIGSLLCTHWEGSNKKLEVKYRLKKIGRERK